MLLGLMADASNIKSCAGNPCYTVEDFLTAYPQFGNGLVPEEMLEEWVELARATIPKKRFNAYWKMAVGLFAAHFAALYLESMRPEGSTASSVLAAAHTAGVVASESADGVSHSMDNSMLTGDLSGWAAWKLTTFGVQFATIAKMVGKGGMYVW